MGDDACIVPLDRPCSVSLLNPYTGTSAILLTQNGVLQIFRVQLGKGAAGSGDPALPLLCGLAAQEDTFLRAGIFNPGCRVASQKAIFEFTKM